MDKDGLETNSVPVSNPGQLTDQLIYKGYDNYKQLHGLALVSSYCSQVSMGYVFLIFINTNYYIILHLYLLYFSKSITLHSK